MPDNLRQVLFAAVQAGRHGVQPEPALAGAILSGSRELTIDQLGFDSLAWMEFCISIELQCGQELTVQHIEDMRHFFEIEDWLRARA